MVLEPDSLMILKRSSPECHFHPFSGSTLHYGRVWTDFLCFRKTLFRAKKQIFRSGMRRKGGECAPCRNLPKATPLNLLATIHVGNPFLKFIVKFIDLGCDPDFSCRMSSRIRTRPGHLSLWRRRHTSGWEKIALEKFAEFFTWILMNLDACSFLSAPNLSDSNLLWYLFHPFFLFSCSLGPLFQTNSILSHRWVLPHSRLNYGVTTSEGTTSYISYNLQHMPYNMSWILIYNPHLKQGIDYKTLSTMKGTTTITFTIFFATEPRDLILMDFFFRIFSHPGTETSTKYRSWNSPTSTGF